MSKTKFRKIEQHQTISKREQYENALTIDKLKSRPRKLSYVEIDLGDGEIANIFFLPMSAADVIRFKDPALEPLQSLGLMVDLLAKKVVDPYTGEPLQGRDEWAEEDQDFLFLVIGAVTGIQVTVEGEEVPEGELVEIDIETLRSDPNPLDATPGSDSPMPSISNSGAEDVKEPGTSSNG